MAGEHIRGVRDIRVVRAAGTGRAGHRGRPGPSQPGQRPDQGSGQGPGQGSGQGSGQTDSAHLAEVVYLDRATGSGRSAAASTATFGSPTWRPHIVFYLGLVGLAGALLADPAGSAGRLCGAWLVPTLGWAAGHHAADGIVPDLNTVARTPRAGRSGRTRPTIGLAGMVTCATAGGILAVALNWRTAPLIAVALFTGLTRRGRLQAHGLAANLTGAGGTALAFLLGTMAVRRYPGGGLLLVAAVFGLHDLATNLVGALRDIDGDRRSGRRTFPVRHGVSNTLVVVVTLCVLWLALAAAAPVSLGLLGVEVAERPAFWGLLGLAAALAGMAVLTLVRAGPRLAPRAHAILALERVALACAFVGLAAGLPVALALLLPAGVLTGLLPTSMRSR